jgi:hypothetical protein
MGRISPRRAAAVAATFIGVLALPAAAHASRFDLALRQDASAKVVNAGGLITYTVTITNQGTEPNEGVFVNLFSLKGHGLGANNPYQSVSTSQGSCPDMSEGGYHQLVCTLGPLASGASAKIVAVVQVNESMNHIAALLPNAFEGGYNDEGESDNESVLRATASVPPTVSGSKMIKLTGLPAGCTPGDFNLRATTKVKGVKKMRASLFLGFDQEGEGHTWQKIVQGSKLRAKVPASRLAPELGVFYKLKVKAKRGGAKPLTVTVTFQPC